MAHFGDSNFSLRGRLPGVLLIIIDDMPKKEMVISPSVLDPGKHTTVIFKENGDTNIINNSSNASIVEGKHIKQGSKGHGTGNKSKNGRNGGKLNRVIRKRGDRFKVAGLFRVPLSDTINSMVDLINCQIEQDLSKAPSSIDDLPVKELGSLE
ncbi:hypothetical protein GOBAR_AA30852 [Gossypium barbadense]|uniref:Uncharacterized protein n=1 Tax=Gossypium barbadense TaxID=3634 RepID=A0A2P5WFI5_GOSBA|nr:hypothetical protein GOBAR_AA30852 [Gossypium barbadense]